MVDKVGAVGAAQDSHDPVAVTQRADPQDCLTTGRDEHWRVQRHIDGATHRPPGEHGRGLCERFQRQHGRQHGHAVDPVVGQIRIAGERHRGRADQLDTRVVHGNRAQEPAASRQSRSAELRPGDHRLRPSRQAADPAVQGDTAGQVRRGHELQQHPARVADCERGGVGGGEVGG